MIYLGGLEEKLRDDVGANYPGAGVVPLLHLVQVLSRKELNPRLFIVTAGAQAVSHGASVAFAASPIWGFARVVAEEHPRLSCVRIDLDSRLDARDIGILARELGRGFGHENELAFRNGRWLVHRLTRVAPHAPSRSVRLSPRQGSFTLSAGESRRIEDLRFARSERRAPEHGEIEVEVIAAGLNFKDVAKATGRLAEEATVGTATGATLGCECVGIVASLGPNVTEFALGQPVCVMAGSTLSTHVTVPIEFAVRRPLGVTDAEAAGLFPLVVAYDVLRHVARVQPGERVLVHSASGGVGLAAIQVARWLGAEVLVTGGTEEKRAYLRELGVRVVGSSRSLAFADEVQRATNGRGVDVIMNTLTGAAIAKGLEVLAPLGRFIELGKTDITEGSALSLGHFNKGVSFVAYDYDRLAALRPSRHQALMREVMDLIDRGTLAPIVVHEFSASRVVQAFETFAKPDHHGKVVVHIKDETVHVAPSSAALFSGEATYLVTGGLSGLGLALAQWIHRQGGRNLVLLGRRGVASLETERVLDQIRAEGTRVLALSADVANFEDLKRVFALVDAELPRLRGVFHSAAVFDDVRLTGLNEERLRNALAAKATGAWNLHRLTDEMDLDYFVLFSSLAAKFGNASLGQYAAANEFLNGLAHHRRALGLPAISIDWGAVAEVGIAARYEHVGQNLARHGYVGLAPTQLFMALKEILETRPTEIAVASVDWKKFAKSNPDLAFAPRFEGLVTEDLRDASEGGASLQTLLQHPVRDTVLPPLVERLKVEVARVLDTSAVLINPADTIPLDSLMAAEIKARVETATGFAIPIVKIIQGVSVNELAEAVLSLASKAVAAERAEPTSGLPRHTGRPTSYSFPSHGGVMIHAHLSLPEGPSPFPAVVVHTADQGGALDASGAYAHLHEHAPLLAAGFAVFTVDQRGAPGHGEAYSRLAQLGAADVDDINAAARFLANIPEIDTNRVAFLGTSRGAYVGLLAITKMPSLWRAAVLMMGFYDPLRYLEVELQERPETSVLRRYSAASWEELREYFSDAARQPLAQLGAMRLPLRIVHGELDEVVSVEQSQQLHERATSQAIPVEFEVLAGLGHDISYQSVEWVAEWNRITAFLKRNVSL